MRAKEYLCRRVVMVMPQRMERPGASSNLMFNAFKISGEVQRSQRRVFYEVNLRMGSFYIFFKKENLSNRMGYGFCLDFMRRWLP